MQTVAFHLLNITTSLLIANKHSLSHFALNHLSDLDLHIRESGVPHHQPSSCPAPSSRPTRTTLRRSTKLFQRPSNSQRYVFTTQQIRTMLIAQQSNVTGAVEKLLALEKQTRQSSDLPSTSRILISIVTICKDAGDWALLNEQAQLLSKKHSQLKQAITKMVQVVMGFLDQTPNIETKLSVIETLRTITEGKVCLRLLLYLQRH